MMIRFKDFLKKEKQSVAGDLGLDLKRKGKRKDGNAVGGDCGVVVQDMPIVDDQNLILVGGIVGEN